MSKMTPARSTRTDAKLKFAFPHLHVVTPARPSYLLTFKAISASRTASLHRLPKVATCQTPPNAKRTRSCCTALDCYSNSSHPARAKRCDQGAERKSPATRQLDGSLGENPLQHSSMKKRSKLHTICEPVSIAWLLQNQRDFRIVDLLVDRRPSHILSASSADVTPSACFDI